MCVGVCVTGHLCGLDDGEVIDAGEACPHGRPQARRPKRHPGAEPLPQLHRVPLPSQCLNLGPRQGVLR